MATPLVTAGLSPSTTARIDACGHPITYVSSSGASVPGHWPCGSSWCTYCALRRRDRIAPIVEQKISATVETVYLVTLTIPHENDLSARYFADQCELVREIWREMMSRIRWARHHLGKHRLASEAWERIPPPGWYEGDTFVPHPDYASEWSADIGWGVSPDILDRGVWVREVTTGSARNPGAHVHAHILVASKRAAQCLNAAWQAVTADFGVRQWRRGRLEFANTDISEVPSGKGAYYVAKYVSKLDALDLKKKGREVERAYVKGTKGMRRCDAWGEWRPLGLALRGGGKMTHIAPEGFGEAVELGEYFGESELARLIRAGQLPATRAGLDEIGMGDMSGEVRAALEMSIEAGCAETKKALRAVGLAIARKRGLTVVVQERDEVSLSSVVIENGRFE